MCFYTGGLGGGEHLYGCGIKVIELSRTRQVPSSHSLSTCSRSRFTLVLTFTLSLFVTFSQIYSIAFFPFFFNTKDLGKQEVQVTFPCQTTMTVTYQQLQAYAADFLWLPGFQELAEGNSDKTWICFVTKCPVLALGRLDTPSLRQQEAISDHIDRHQPQKPRIQDHPLLVRRRALSPIIVS